MLPVHQLDVEEQGVPVLLPLLVVQGDPRVVEPPHGGLPPQHGQADPPRRQGPGGVLCTASLQLPHTLGPLPE